MNHLLSKFLFLAKYFAACCYTDLRNNSVISLREEQAGFRSNESCNVEIFALHDEKERKVKGFYVQFKC